MKESKAIPSIKSKSKIKPLQKEIESLTYEKDQLLEELYEAGVRQRPTMMSKIEEKEEETLRYIKYCISECEKETGRCFPHYITKYVSVNNLFK